MRIIRTDWKAYGFRYPIEIISHGVWLSYQGETASRQLQRDAIREFVARTRAEQGLPPTIEDPTALDRIGAAFQLVKGSQAGRDAG